MRTVRSRGRWRASLKNQRLAQLWLVRLILWGAAALAGLVVVGFSSLAEWALGAFSDIDKRWPWAPLLLTPLVGMAVVWATRRFVPGAAGSGIPQVAAANHLAAHGKPVGGLLSLRIVVGKIALGVLALFGGFSAGREGPSVQVASSILHMAHRFLPVARSVRSADLILAGGAAGLAAAFNTPLAGIVFAVEELGRRLEARTSGVLVSTIIISGLVSIAVKGDYTYFGQLTVHEVGAKVVMPALVSGVVCGLLGGLFSWLLLWPVRHPSARLWAWRAAHPIRFAGACGLLVAALGLISGGTSFGSGYASAAAAISGQVPLAWHAPITRFVATLATYFCGMPGGLFAPALAVGTGIGSDLSNWIGAGVDAHAWIALCMAAFLGAVTQSPITAAIIVMEMVNGHEMVISLMAVAFLSQTISGRFGPELYQRLAQSWGGASAEQEETPTLAGTEPEKEEDK